MPAYGDPSSLPCPPLPADVGVLYGVSSSFLLSKPNLQRIASDWLALEQWHTITQADTPCFCSTTTLHLSKITDHFSRTSISPCAGQGHTTLTTNQSHSSSLCIMNNDQQFQFVS